MVFQDGPFQIGGKGYVTLLIAFAVEQDHVIPDVLFQYIADLRVAGSGVKGNGQNKLVPCG